MRARLNQNNSTFAKQKRNQKFIHINCQKMDSTTASRVHLTQNQLTAAQQFHTFKSNTVKHHISDFDFDLRVRFTHNKLTLAGHNPLLFNQSYIPHNSNPYLQLTLVDTQLNLNSHHIV